MTKRLSNLLPDSWYLRLAYKKTHGYFPDLHNPRTFNEKIQWCKLYYRNPLLTKLADKFEVRQYVREKGFHEILNDIYNVYNEVDEIDISCLPDSFVIKATHGSNMNIICKDKSKFDWHASRRLLQEWHKTNYFFHGREWAYKNITPRFICEKYLENDEFGELIDYKFYCFNSRPELFFICTDRFGGAGLKYTAFDLDWNSIGLYKGKPTSEIVVEKPDSFAEMKMIATELCKGLPFVRVDMYSVNHKTIFGELTFYPDCGMIPFTPDHFNFQFGDLLVLPEKTGCGRGFVRSKERRCD